MSFKVLFPAILLFVSGIMVYGKDCGRPPLLENRIVGGADAAEGSWPWQVDVQTSNNGHICGGSIISEKWILSAAHCFPNPSDVSSYIIYVGRHQLNGFNFHDSSHRVRQVIVPSGYMEPHSGQDVALVELSTPITWSDYASPICLPSSGTLFPSGMQCYVTGWGNIRDDDACAVMHHNGKTLHASTFRWQIADCLINLQHCAPVDMLLTHEQAKKIIVESVSKTPYLPLPGVGTLQEVQVPIISQSSCQEMYSLDPKDKVDILYDMICAGYQEGGKDSCQGDSGGPLVCQMVNGTWVQAGVVSFGEGCAHRNKPGVYARLTTFTGFLTNTVPELRLYGQANQNWCGRTALLVGCLSLFLILLQR